MIISKMTDSITTGSIGKNKYAIDLDGLDSGVYRAVVFLQQTFKIQLNFQLV